ncbi:MAG: hypothetical protein ACK5CA_07885, partial [Cyanobacteriota bacterium]
MALLLAACGAPAPSPTADNALTPTPAPTAQPAQAPNQKTPHGGQGGQVIESGPYHLELLSAAEGGVLHLDFYLQSGADHRPIADAKVMGKLQGPNGAEEDLVFKYSAQDEHYTALLTNPAPGSYKLAILSDIKGQKVNGRFSFEYAN